MSAVWRLFGYSLQKQASRCFARALCSEHAMCRCGRVTVIIQVNHVPFDLAPSLRLKKICFRTRPDISIRDCYSHFTAIRWLELLVSGLQNTEEQITKLQGIVILRWFHIAVSALGCKGCEGMPYLLFSCFMSARRCNYKE